MNVTLVSMRKKVPALSSGRSTTGNPSHSKKQKVRAGFLLMQLLREGIPNVPIYRWTSNPDASSDGNGYTKGALLGNGDMDVAEESTGAELIHHTSIAEFANRSCGKLVISRDGGSGSGGIVAFRQNMREGVVEGNPVLDDTRFRTHSWVPFLTNNHENLLIVEISHDEILDTKTDRLGLP